METRMTLYELFGPITKRLYDLKNKVNLNNETYLGIWGNGYQGQVAAILDKIVEFEDSASITILNSLLIQIEEIRDIDFADALEEDAYNIDTLKAGILEELGFYQYNFTQIREVFHNRLESNNSREKIKTSLTVPELAYLFRMLNKIDIFEVRNKTDLHRFVAINFESKRAPDISDKSIKNKFDTPDIGAMGFWEEKLHLMLSNLRKDKENI